MSIRYGHPRLDRAIDLIKRDPKPRRRTLFILAGMPKELRRRAAGKLARAFGTALYPVDLSAVVSKYIGDTTRRLAALLDEADRKGGTLFFDEADALFGKRTDVKDAHGRYANIGIRDLLQAMETFAGIVVLAAGSAREGCPWHRVRQIIVRWPPFLDCNASRRTQ